MSEQPTTTKARKGGNSKVTQGAAGVAGALAFLGFGWVMGQRSVTVQPAAIPASNPATAAVPLPIPGEWGDEEGGQWGTLPGTASPAQPGTGGVTAPVTGSGGSSVAGTSISTTSVSMTSTAPATTTASATTAGATP